MLLAPAEFAIELAVGDMQEAELRQDCAIRLGEVEPDRVCVPDLQPQPWVEVQIPSRVKLMAQLGTLFHIELDDLRIKDFAVMKGHPGAELHFQGAVIEPLPAGR